MEDNQDNLACTPLEIREIAKNTVKFFLFLTHFLIYTDMHDKIIPYQTLPTYKFS
jgi:hypothetical protein